MPKRNNFNFVCFRSGLMIKVRHCLYLLGLIVLKFPLRVRRWFIHPFNGKRTRGSSLLIDILFWVVESCLLLLDILGIPEWYEIIQIGFKRNIRFLTHEEMTIGNNLFGDSIDWKRVKLDSAARIGAKSGGFAYVSFYMINYWGRMYESTFVHELVHIWQFESFGSPYIVRALRAQYSEAKYNYGGLDNLQSHLDNGGKFSDLNYEQQGDILADYYRIKTGRLKLRGVGRLQSMIIYEQLLTEIGP